MDLEMYAEVLLLQAAATYGPTRGPPPGAPAGTTGSVEVSAMASARFSRPLPVWSTVPAGSALRASRPTTTSFAAEGSFATSSAAAPATKADEAEVPVIEVVPEPTASALM